MCILLVFGAVSLAMLALAAALTGFLYEFGWVLLATLFVSLAAAPRPPPRQAVGVALALAAVRTATGLGSLAVLGAADARSRLEPALVALSFGLPWAEATVLALVTGGALRWLGTPTPRALLAGVLLEVASALYARLLPLRAVLERAAVGEAVVEDTRLVAWEPSTGIGIDEAGRAFRHERFDDGPFDEVETWCLHRAGTEADWTCFGAPSPQLLRRAGSFGIRPDGGLHVPEQAGSAVTELLPRRDLLDLSQDADRLCVLGTDGESTCVPRGADRGSALLPSPPGPAERISIRGPVACAIDPLGEVVCAGDTACWGPPAAGPFVSLHAGTAEVCAKRADGGVSCWGAPWVPALEEGARDARPTDDGRGVVDGAGRPRRQPFSVRPCGEAGSWHG